MSKIAISVENLGKKYQIGELERYYTLRDTLTNIINYPKKFFSNNDREDNSDDAKEYIWALKDVSFEVKHGEVVGIIGRNGAGKSTLLKVLSRITTPTEGIVRLNGRVASLLEVGTGFHPELTGRENIYLNGSILGMSKKEIERKFDEIVEFAEIEKFLDTPVKRYSSGMYVRLAFAVAAHLEPEILLVDEVLAVGDISFQKKCLGKIDNVAKEGRTVLFVSHNMGMITALCGNAILLEKGNLTEKGSASDVVLSYYTNGHMSPSYVDYTKINKKVGNDLVELIEGYVKNRNGDVVSEVTIDQEVVIGMRFKILEERSFNNFFPYPFMNFISSEGRTVFYSSLPNEQCKQIDFGEYLVECVVPKNLLNSGTYFVNFGFADCDNGIKLHFIEENALCFQVIEDLEDTLYDSRNGFSGEIPGVIRPQLKWDINKLN